MSSIQNDQVVSLVFGDTEDSIRAVDHVFAVLAATYTAAWERSLGTTPISDVKTAWAYQLGQFTHSQTAKRAILWGLRNLPDTAPSAIQFRNICRMAPTAEAIALPAPAATPERVAAELAKLATLRTKPAQDSGHGMKAWAYRLQERHKAGEKLNMNQVRCFQTALGVTA